MNIDPVLVHNHLAERPPLAPELIEADRTAVTSAAQPSGMPDSLGALQRQFTSFMKDLTQQLSSLEKRFMAALKQFSNAFAEAEKDQLGKADCPPHKIKHGRLPHQPMPHTYRSMVSKAAQRYQLDPALINAVIYQESGFRNNAISSPGAVGLMQLMPDTARSLGVNDPFNPQQNIDGGAQLLRQMLDRYNGQLDLALAAYNAGPAAVDKYGGIPPYAETQNYVQNVLSVYRDNSLTTSPA